jgi:PilZ domain
MASLTTDMRRYPRVPFDSKVLIRAVSSQPPVEARTVVIEARTVDLSLSGVGIIAPVAFRLGSWLTLGFELRDVNPTVVVERLSARVIFRRPGEGDDRLGMEFFEPLHRSRTPRLARWVEPL